MSLATALPFASATDLTAPMSVGRFSHTASPLPDGRILISGGTLSTSNAGSMTNRAEIYDPLTGAFTPTAPMNVARTAHASALLPDGRIIVIGGTGQVNFANVSLASTEIYDAASATWTMGPTLGVARSAAKAVTLSDGKIVVISSTGNTTSSEVYDPLTGAFMPGGSLAIPRNNFEAVALADNRILVVGGYLLAGGMALNAELRDPVTGVWTVAAPLAFGRYMASATKLLDGRVLVAGGCGNSPQPVVAELFDPATGTFTATGSLGMARYGHTAQLLVNGNVALFGGTAADNISHDVVEDYNVATGQWRYADHLTEQLKNHTVSLLGNGKVLLTGGYTGPTAAAQLFNENCAMFNTALSVPGITFTGEGGSSATLGLTIPSGCRWSITRIPSWLTINSGTTGTGSAVISMTAGLGTTYTRGATMRVANLDFNAQQTLRQPTCDTSVQPTLSIYSNSHLAVGGGGSVTVSVPAGCPWSVAGTPSWVIVTRNPSGAIGLDWIDYTVAANSGAARSATMTIAGRSFVLSQSAYAVGCDPAAGTFIFPSSQTFGEIGGNGSVNVTRGASCTWTTTLVPSWITLTAGAAGSGNGTVTYTVAPNTGAARAVNLNIAGYAYNVAQSAATSTPPTVPATCPVTAVTIGVGTAGTLAGTDCSNGARGVGYYTDRFSFSGTAGQRVAIQLSSSAFDSYLYLKSPTNLLVASDDDGGGGTNSRIPASAGSITLPVTGTYVIEATTYYSGRTGAYSLTVLQY
ncbi:pre-peptidase C-terminal domain-containing protein [Massilia sp. TSP1-1-2]|uniref:pre-peptidase C-terminal domain-containing protein n=1 Tax=Massilia sp. TSP1-1-2 TaxID=2804649 RepID=UPI003CE6CB05